MKQSKLRRRRVVRYAILYFVLLVVFVALIAGPVVLKKVVFKTKDLQNFYKQLQIGGMVLMQPNFLKNDNTQASSETGTANPSYTYPSGYRPSTATGDSATSTP